MVTVRLVMEGGVHGLGLHHILYMTRGFVVLQACLGPHCSYVFNRKPSIHDTTRYQCLPINLYKLILLTIVCKSRHVAFTMNIPVYCHEKDNTFSLQIK